MDVFGMALTIGLLGAASRIPDGRQYGWGLTCKVYAVLLVVYGVRLRLKIVNVHRRRGLTVFFGTLALLLPYVYAFITLLSPPMGLPIHKWFGDPLCLFLVPVASFFFFELSRPSISTTRFVFQMIAEFMIVFPLWACAWIYLQLIVTDAVL